MQVTKDPRCPKHPMMEVWVQYRPGMIQVDGPSVWICSACKRPLGCASLAGFWASPWPQGRRKTQEEMSCEAYDWDWHFRLADRRGLLRKVEE